MNKQRMYLCDFGFGVQRYDISGLSLHENIAKDGTYEGQGVACQFGEFDLLEWCRKVKRFLGWS